MITDGATHFIARIWINRPFLQILFSSNKHQSLLALMDQGQDYPSHWWKMSPGYYTLVVEISTVFADYFTLQELFSCSVTFR